MNKKKKNGFGLKFSLQVGLMFREEAVLWVWNGTTPPQAFTMHCPNLADVLRLCWWLLSKDLLHPQPEGCSYTQVCNPHCSP